MIDINGNFDQFIDHVKAEQLKLNKHVAEVYRGMALMAFDYIVRETPQWTGKLAGNWNFSVGTADSTTHYQRYDNEPMQHEDVQKNDPVFVEKALNRARKFNNMIPALNATLHISNGSYSVPSPNDLDSLPGDPTTDYKLMCEFYPEGFLRPVNTPGHMMENAVLMFNSDFNVLSVANEHLLKGFKL